MTTPTIRPTDSESAGRVVVGVDGSESSVAALRWAAKVAPALHLEIDALTSWFYPPSYGYAGGAMDWHPDADAEAVSAQALGRAFGDGPPAGLRTIIREGHPARVLVDASHGARLLVVGSRGHGGFTGLLLGSVSAYCAEHAYCPVVVDRLVVEPVAAVSS